MGERLKIQETQFQCYQCKVNRVCHRFNVSALVTPRSYREYCHLLASQHINIPQRGWVMQLNQVIQSWLVKQVEFLGGNGVKR
ncbi:hypothetical protein GDO86_017506 [Hymenochirus boettgeri]|uniref:Uncharacterized protein n=1 Tax=Hymenochirus boettgeri TaxID=247094 RepID=A0A8T2ISU6_9PIPI|nr:hypothetical protein GDO86_017506 [Hymenochirus boettgeri]